MPAMNMASRTRTITAVNTTSDVPLIMRLLLSHRLSRVVPRPPDLILASETPYDIPQMEDLSLAQIG